MSTNQVAPELDIPVKPLKGKYDGRRNNGPTAARKRTYTKVGRKPNWAKHLSRNDAAKTQREIHAIASPSEIYARALEKNQLALCWQIIERVEDRLLGKPFVAENPNAKAVTNVLNQDNRLQIAIQQLVPPKQERKRKKTQAIEATGEAKQLTPGDSQTQTYVDATAQVVDYTLDGGK